MYPILVGAGKRLFAELAAALPLTLLETRSLDKGVVLLRYGEKGLRRGMSAIGFERNARFGGNFAQFDRLIVLDSALTSFATLNVDGFSSPPRSPR